MLLEFGVYSLCGVFVVCGGVLCFLKCAIWCFVCVVWAICVLCVYGVYVLCGMYVVCVWGKFCVCGLCVIVCVLCA